MTGYDLLNLGQIALIGKLHQSKDIKTTLSIFRLLLNNSGLTLSPWSNSTDCSHYKIQFAQIGSLDPTALVSFPGSGNSWTRFRF